MTERVQKNMTEITRNLFQMTVLIRKMMEKSMGKVISKESYYNYCNCSKTLRDKLQRLQNREARVLTNSNYGANASILINDLKLSGKFRGL